MAVIKAQFTLRLDINTYAKIKILAEKESRSLNNMIEYIARKEIAAHEAQFGEIEISDADIYLD